MRIMDLEELFNINEKLCYLYVPLDVPCEQSLALAKCLNVEIVTDLDCLNEDSSFYDEIKRRYNPLLKIQNYILLNDSKSFMYEIPYFYLCFYDDESPFKRIVEALDDIDYVGVFECLINFVISKNLRFLKEALSYKKNIDLAVFTLLEKLAEAHFKKESTESLEQAVTSAIKTPVNHDSENDCQLSKITDILKMPHENQNLVLIHLESVSHVIYNANKSLFPNLNKVGGNSLCFTNYFSTATTTIMALCSIFYGNEFEPDTASNYYGLSLGNTYNKNLFHILSESGYKTAPFAYTSR